ncbi:hypothetical protein CJ030_MR6G010448 [Morella rubra]|uniref:Uncharacterized protein n=1 Tax=Morella rubra TaxID=262757 RepID=A0A6A1V998_9ROSI|nr:hypothetical protein CJ030_MR6G010448 [Morella rubra]
MAPQQHPCLACQPACHRHAMTAHGLATWPCHDTVPQQVLGHQPSQASTAGQADKGVPLHQMATTSGGAPPPLPVLGGERKRKGHRVEGAPPPMEVQAAAAPPWTAVDGGERWQGPRGALELFIQNIENSRVLESLSAFGRVLAKHRHVYAKSVSRLITLLLGIHSRLIT